MHFSFCAEILLKENETIVEKVCNIVNFSNHEKEIKS